MEFLYLLERICMPLLNEFMLAVKEGLRTPLEQLLPVYPARAVRYFLVVMTAGTLWPLSFKYFSKLGVKE